MPQNTRRSKLGQNFLVNLQACEAIAAASGDLSQRAVVEIGPGRGAITEILAARAQQLIAIELDTLLAAQLRQRFAAQTHVKIMEADVLDVDFGELQTDKAKLEVIGNLPYYITSDILLHLFRYSAVIHRAVIMVQREVAERVLATPGTSEYGVLSATAQMFAQVEKLMTLPPDAFSPPPEVHSTVIRLTMAPRFEELKVDAEGFFAFLRAGFAQKRKMLAKNLRIAGLEAQTIATAFEKGCVSSTARAEELTLEQSAALYREIKGQNSIALIR
ncbi:ribosomal RNA small subunit methyltransferase A [Acidipila sp. 4G-K13]|uniref:Ribosomal RNA small subunit methyltransferase A n=2 Tax=Paracidobacterium acidisoli TaxID=2303751 RepID=A0A372ISI4_9BACT|nr:ribosomal RNA small subunit methyltransferase A [Paracidobacterium acidisoli]